MRDPAVDAGSMTAVFLGDDPVSVRVTRLVFPGDIYWVIRRAIVDDQDFDILQQFWNLKGFQIVPQVFFRVVCRYDYR